MIENYSNGQAGDCFKDSLLTYYAIINKKGLKDLEIRFSAKNEKDKTINDRYGIENIQRLSDGNTIFKLAAHSTI